MDVAFIRGEGTAGIEGQLYETKLISLILFRLLHNQKIEQFSLASNYDDIGKFDDICLKVKVFGETRPILVLIQAKHKEQKKKETKDLEYAPLIKHFLDALAKVKNKFLKEDNIFFSGDFRDTKCVFILYTNAAHVKNFTKNSADNDEYDRMIHDIVGTGKVARVDYNEKIKEHEATQLAEHFAPFFKTNPAPAMNIMDDSYISRYHVYLAQHVVKCIGENISEKSRIWNFRSNFFDTSNIDNNMVLFKDKLLENIFIHQLQDIVHDPETVSDTKATTRLQDEISKFISEPTLSTLRPLVKMYSLEEIDSKNKKKKEKTFFIAKRPEYDVGKLKAAERRFAETILRKRVLRVPITFGNIDLIIKKKQTLTHLAKVITDWCEKSKINEQYRIVTLDKSLDSEILKAKPGGIGSAIGNLFVYDEETKYLMFTKDHTSLKENASTLFKMLLERIGDGLDKYRFDVRDLIDIPLLCFNFTEEAKLLHIYYKQSNQRGLEEILKEELDEQRSIKNNSSSVKIDTIFLHLHNEIQKWSLLKKAPYFEKTSDIYERIIRKIELEAQMTALTYDMDNMTYSKYDFTDKANEGLRPIENLARNVVVIDLQYTLRISDEAFSTLISELNNTQNVPKALCNIIKNSDNVRNRLDQVSKETNMAKAIFITNKHEQSLCDLMPDFQQHIIEKAEVLFQGKKVKLKMLVDNNSIQLIRGAVLKKILAGKTIEIGRSLGKKYDIGENIHIHTLVREVTKSSPSILLKTFQDIEDRLVLITAEPGMGKSTLLDHLAVNDTDNKIWIVKIKFIDLAGTFESWCNKKVISILDVIHCIWRHISKKGFHRKQIELALNEGEVFVKNGGDEEIVFEMNLFLHFYKSCRLIFLLDGFDEVCPEYNKQAIGFIEALKNNKYKNNIWVTSRPYIGILGELESVSGKNYTLESFTHEEQKKYLEDYWRARINLESISMEQINKVVDQSTNIGT